jgi:hypothetical protein
MRVTKITTNYGYAGNSAWQDEYEVGKLYDNKKVTHIEYFTPMGVGDAHRCDISFEDGSKLRVFNLDKIWMEDDK